MLGPIFFPACGLLPACLPDVAQAVSGGESLLFTFWARAYCLPAPRCTPSRRATQGHSLTHHHAPTEAHHTRGPHDESRTHPGCWKQALAARPKKGVGGERCKHKHDGIFTSSAIATAKVNGSCLSSTSPGDKVILDYVISQIRGCLVAVVASEFNQKRQHKQYANGFGYVEVIDLKSEATFGFRGSGAARL